MFFFLFFPTVYIYVIIQQRQRQIIVFSFKKPIHALYHFLPNGNFKKKTWLHALAPSVLQHDDHYRRSYTAAVWMPVPSSPFIPAGQKRFVLKIKTYAPRNVIIPSVDGVFTRLCAFIRRIMLTIILSQANARAIMVCAIRKFLFYSYIHI